MEERSRPLVSNENWVDSAIKVQEDYKMKNNERLVVTVRCCSKIDKKQMLNQKTTKRKTKNREEGCSWDMDTRKEQLKPYE